MVYRDCRLLVLDLGNLRVASEKTADLPQSPNLTVEEVKEKAYDKFRIKLEKVQLLYASAGTVAIRGFILGGFCAVKSMSLFRLIKATNWTMCV